MRTALRIGIGAALLAAGAAEAAIPVNVQQRAHLRTIIDLPALADFFPVSRIELVGANVWRLTAGRCHVEIAFVERPGPYPGRGLIPPRLEPRVGRRVCQR